MVEILILALSLIYISMLLWFYYQQDRIVFRPETEGRGHIAQPADFQLPCQDLTLTTRDQVQLHAWWIEAAQASEWTLLYFHGNNSNLSHQLETLQLLRDSSMNILAIDYRGYGKSAGAPSELGLYQDALAAWETARERGARPERCIVMGRSLGGGVASYVAEQCGCAALILESTYTSVVDVGAQRYPFLPVRWLSRNCFPTLERLKRLDCPSLIIHSREDETIPWDNALRLLDASQRGELLEISGLHGDGYSHSASTYRRGVADFIGRIQAAAAGGTE